MERSLSVVKSTPACVFSTPKVFVVHTSEQGRWGMLSIFLSRQKKQIFVRATLGIGLIQPAHALDTACVRILSNRYWCHCTTADNSRHQIKTEVTPVVAMGCNHFDNKQIFDETRNNPTFWTERVKAALHLPTNPWSFLVTLRWFECTALNSSLILPAPACRYVDSASTILAYDSYKHGGLQRLSLIVCVLLTTYYYWDRIRTS